MGGGGDADRPLIQRLSPLPLGPEDDLSSVERPREPCLPFGLVEHLRQLLRHPSWLVPTAPPPPPRDHASIPAAFLPGMAARAPIHAIRGDRPELPLPSVLNP